MTLASGRRHLAPQEAAFGVHSSWWIRSPNNLAEDHPFASTARRHGDFDDDDATVRSSLGRILGGPTRKPGPAGEPLSFRPTESGLDARRRALDKAVRRDP